nr:SPOR domain-containing protein [uncultured Sphingomonas sp.]
MTHNAFWLAAAAVLLPQAASAQYIGGRAPEPPPPPVAGMQETPEAALARNIRLIAINPRNYEAQLAAGRAALRLGDPQAAIGFFGRAEEINAAHWAAKAGQGSAMAHMGEAQAALGLFEQAQALGGPVSLFAIDRGLAFDLLGRQAEAQADYRLMLPLDEGEARRRLALSLAISGRRAEALTALDPLLARRDQAARRTRAFILALGGDLEGARQAIAAMLPGSSSGFDPFLRRLPTLGPGQKAAAVHLGIMPAEGTALAALHATEPPAPAAVPVAAPVREARVQPVRVAPRAARPTSPPASANSSAAPAAGASLQAAGDRLASIESSLVTLPSAPPPPRPIVERTAAARAAAPPPAPKPIVERSASRRASAPEFDLASRPGSDERGRNSNRPPAKANETKPVKLAAAAKGTTAENTGTKAAGAGARNSKAAEDAKPAKPAAASASRIYVQLAGGANADRMGREYDRIRKTKASLFRARQPLVSAVKGWSRLLVGPFKDSDEAQGFVNDLHAAKLSGFVWTAPAGLKLEKLDTK